MRATSRAGSLALAALLLLASARGQVADPGTAAATETGAPVLASAHTVAGPTPVGRGRAAAPTTPTVREFGLTAVTRKPAAALRAARSARTSPDAASGLVAVSTPRPVSGYGVVGVTWQGRTPAALTLAVRTRIDGGRWSPWQALEAEDSPCPSCDPGQSASEHGPDAGTPEFVSARSGTDALAVGEVDEVQIRVDSPHGRLPKDLTLAVVDPGETVTAPSGEMRSAPPSRAPSTFRTAVATAETSTLSTSGTTVPRPTILSRADWGADESMRSGKPSYGTISAGFVHHTVNSNGYTREQVPAIIRGIYAYHTQSRGWSDIGYNFLVDRFGRIWEGRYGGVDRPVIGAHTYGYNHLAFAMSAIGDFDRAEPSTRMLDAYGALMAWKLSLHGIPAKSTQVLGSTSFRAISGHRDAGQTVCPGQYLYAKLGAIRNRAAGIQDAAVVPEPSPPEEPTPVYVRGPQVVRDLDGDGLADLLARDSATGQLQMLAGDRGPGFEEPRPARIRGDRHDLLAGVGDVTGDGLPDVLTRIRRTGLTQLRPGRPNGLFRRPVPEADTWKFRGVDLLAGAGNLVGNRRPDVVARDVRTKRLWVYPGRAGGLWGARRLLLEEASRLSSVAGVGDLDGDGRDDVLATAGRRLLLYPGLGAGQLGAARVLSREWDGMDLTVAGPDLTGDGIPDLLARERATGRTWIYDLDPDGRPGPRLGGWLRWRGLTGLVAVGAPADTGVARLIGRTRSDELLLLESTNTGWLATPTETERALADADFVQVAGDLTGDGHADVLARSAETGNVFLYAGTGDGRLMLRKRVRAGWTDRSDLVVTPDLTGDEVPDLLARGPDGAIYVYAGNGEGGLLKGVVARPRLIRTDLVTPVGYWNDDDVRDLVVRHAVTKELYLVPGTTSATLGKPVLLADSFAAYDRIVGVGDRDGDGRPDLVATEAATGRLWLFRGTATGLGEPEFLAPDLRRFTPLG